MMTGDALKTENPPLGGVALTVLLGESLVSCLGGTPRTRSPHIEVDTELFSRLLWAAKDLKHLIDVQAEGTVRVYGNHGPDAKKDVAYLEASSAITAAEHVRFG